MVRRREQKEEGLMRAIGVDVGGHKVAAALVEDGRIVRRTEESTAPPLTPDVVAPQIGRMAALLGSRDGIPVGVGFPAAFDAGRDHVCVVPNLSGWVGAPIRRILSEAVGAPVEVENDANCYALGEGWSGAAMGLSDYVVLTLGSGIGGGVILGGRLLRGSHGMAGEPGHIAVGRDEPCGCGRFGHVEAIAGANAIEREAALCGFAPDARALWRDRDNPLVRPLWDRVFEALGRAVGAVACLLDPEAVIVGGGVSRGEGFVGEVRSAALRFLPDCYSETLDVRASALGNDAALIGAASLTRCTDTRAPTEAPGRGP